MKFSLEIGPQSTLENLPPVKDVYITMLPGGDYKETAAKSGELVEKGFNPVPHFPARSINDDNELKDYVTRCKDLGAVSYTHLRAHETPEHLVCRLLLEKKK